MSVDKLAKQLTEKHQCPYCPKSYDDKETLNDHDQANHWKKLRPKKRGKP